MHSVPAINATRFREQDKFTPGLPASLLRVLVHLLVSGTVADNGSRSRNRGMYIAVSLKKEVQRHMPGEFHDCSWFFLVSALLA